MTSNVFRIAWLVLLAVPLLSEFSVKANTYVVSNKNDSGAGSLRQAILDANANPGPDTITFNITGATPYNIFPDSPLPTITDPVFIDGTTQAGYATDPLIGLVGLNAGTANGLAIQASGCEIRALTINRFSGNGIQIQGHSNVVAGCYVGTSLAGTTKFGNGAAGVTIVNGVNNRIGGSSPGARNLISGNGVGVYIVGLFATNNFVQGNFIGSDVDGTARLGNDGVGILLSAARNLIGGTAAGEGNLISGNGQSGVYLNDIGATANRVLGNLIGTRVNGASALSNGVDGVTIFRARENIVGGTTPGARNIISGNHERGVLIVGPNAVSNRVEGNFVGTDISGRTNIGNRFTGVGIIGGGYNVVGSTNGAGRNVIAGNNQSGASIDSNSVANIIMGNVIGLDATGTNALPNAWNGVSVLAGTNTVIGGTAPGAGNAISGNTQNGVQLVGGINTVVQGNLIGTDISGRLARGNVLGGVRVENAGHWIGGETPPARNIISANGGSGIFISGPGASNNVVAGNFLGTDITGTARLGNSISGVGITNAPRNLIGTPAPFGGNLISANNNSGIYVSGAAATGNRLRGNLVGTDVTGTLALGNFIGGIYIYGAGTNFIGDAQPGARNVISGNRKVAVAIGDPGASGNVLLGNFIGTRVDGTSPLPNEWHGVELLNTADGNVVGGTSPGEANRLAYATIGGYDGVRVRDGCLNNVIRGNAIFGNGGVGIDLGASDGPNANDLGDTDAGANNLQNFPVLLSAAGRFITTIAGTLNSVPNASFVIDFYGNAAADPTGFGEGQRHFGAVAVTTAADGNAVFSVVLTNSVSIGAFVSATATDAGGNTSEFSAVTAVAPSLDTDGDGLPDDFEMAFGLDPNSGADRDLDPDGDGATNYEEFLAGTRPNDRASALRISIEKQRDFSSVLIESVAGETYRLEAAGEVTGPWNILADNFAGTGGWLRVIDPTAAPQRFYRARAMF